MCILEMKSMVLVLIGIGIIDLILDFNNLAPSLKKEPSYDRLRFISEV